QGKTGTRLTVGWESLPRTYDPRYAIDANSQYLENLLHCSLVDYDSNGQLISNLAKKWAWKDSKTLDVELLNQVKFADGSTVSAEDVKATFDYFIQEKHKFPTPRSGAFNKLKAVSIKGNIITFQLSEPDVTFIDNLAVGILPSKWVKE